MSGFPLLPHLNSLVTNISPQVGVGFNRGYWLQIESFVRGLTKKFDDVYVISGPLFLPKFDAQEGKHFVKYEVLGDPPNTAVPTHFYKVVLAVKDDKKALGGFVVPNDVIDDVPLSEFVIPIEGTPFKHLIDLITPDSYRKELRSRLLS